MSFLLGFLLIFLFLGLFIFIVVFSFFRSLFRAGRRATYQHKKGTEDRYNQSAKREKVFGESEGEYVDYEEVKD